MIELVVVDDADWVATATTELSDAIATCLRRRKGPVWVALSGGSTPKPVFEQLGSMPLDWSRVHFTQVDERIVGDDDPHRNLVMLEAALGHTGATWHPMPARDSAEALRDFAGTLPAAIDVIHLGLGADGHTASLVPGDAALAVIDERVTVTGPYQGHRRVTLTVPELAGATERGSTVIWLIRGADKAHAVGGLLAGFGSLPAAAVLGPDDRLVLDAAAAGAIA